MITRTVTRAVARGIFANRSKALPPIRDKLLLTLRPYAYGEDVYMDDISGNLGEDVVIEWRERYGEDVPIVAYMIPESMQAEMFAIFGEGLWFDSEGTAKQVNCIELAQSPEINQWAVWYRLDAAAGLGNREVLFYNPDTLLYSEYIKISNYFKNTSGLYDAILYYDAEEDPDTELTGGPSTFNSSILGPQYQRNADGSYSVTDYNLIPNSEAVGASVGVAPTGWTISSSGGITSSVIGAGDGYVDIRFSGTTSGAAYPAARVASLIPAVAGETFSCSVSVTVLSGTVVNQTALYLNETPDAGTYLAGTVSTISSSSGVYQITRTLTHASATKLLMYVGLTINSAGVACDLTLRISRPQLTKSSTQLPYKPTYGTSVATPAVDTLEDGFVGLRSCGAVTNLIHNPEAVGASVGVAPTGWTLSGATTGGVTATVVGAGEGYVDYRVFGTATANSYRSISPHVAINAILGDMFNSSFRVTILSGTTASGGSCYFVLAELSLENAYLTSSTVSVVNGDLSLSRTTSNASVAYIRCYVDVFTPSGQTVDITIRISRPQLTKSSYPQPYCVGTMPASNATSTGGNWFTNPDGSPLWQSLTGAPLTLATRIKMGVGSGDLSSSTYAIVGVEANSGSNVQYMLNGGVINKAYDGSVTAVNSAAWSRNSIIRRFTQVNTAGTQFRVGYMIEGANTTIQWSTWAAYDGSFNPSTLYRLMLGYNNPYPMWLNKLAVWKRQVSDAELLEVF